MLTTKDIQTVLEAVMRPIVEPGQDFPPRITQTMTFEDNGVAFPYVERPDLTQLAVRAHALAGTSTAFADLVMAVRSDPRWTKRFLIDAGGTPVPEGSEGWWLTTVLVQPALTEYVRINGSISWSDASFSALVDEIVAYAGRDTVTYEAIAPLDGLSTDFDLLDLDGVRSIRRWSEEQRTKLFEDTYLPPFSHRYLDVDDLMAWSHIAVETWDIPIDERPTPTHEDAFGDVMSALRLLQPGWVGVRLSLSRPLGPSFGILSGVQTRSSFLSRPLFPTSDTYVLRADQQGELRELFARLRGRTPDSVFDLALRRFHSAYERIVDEDKIIDHWVALEALFLPDTKQELSYRASLRVARFLGATQEERRHLFRETMGSYKVRSQIVHGAHVSDLQKWTTLTEDLVRRSLTTWLDPQRDHSIKAIDAALLA